MSPHITNTLIFSIHVQLKREQLPPCLSRSLGRECDPNSQFPQNSNMVSSIRDGVKPHLETGLVLGMKVLKSIIFSTGVAVSSISFRPIKVTGLEYPKHSVE